LTNNYIIIISCVTAIITRCVTDAISSLISHRGPSSRALLHQDSYGIPAALRCRLDSDCSLLVWRQLPNPACRMAPFIIQMLSLLLTGHCLYLQDQTVLRSFAQIKELRSTVSISNHHLYHGSPLRRYRYLLHLSAFRDTLLPCLSPR
jgi:hypothetical protein